MMCLLFLRKMVDSGIEPDLLTYTALIESFGRSGNVEASLELSDEMNSRSTCLAGPGDFKPKGRQDLSKD